MPDKSLDAISHGGTGERLFSLRRDQPEMLISLEDWKIVEVNHILREWFGRKGEPDPTTQVFRNYVPGWVEEHENKEQFAIEEAKKGKRTRDIFSSQGSAIYLPTVHTEIKCRITTDINPEMTLVIARFVDLTEQVQEIEVRDARIAELENETRRYELEVEVMAETTNSTYGMLSRVLLAVVLVSAMSLLAAMVLAAGLGVDVVALIDKNQTLAFAAVVGVGGYVVGNENGKKSAR